jgi:hypothetical protein
MRPPKKVLPGRSCCWLDQGCQDARDARNPAPLSVNCYHGWGKGSARVSMERGTDEMNRTTKLVTSAEELVAATNDMNIRQIIVGSDLSDIPSISLRPGQTLRSDSQRRSTLTFRENADGVQVSSDNAVIALDLVVSPEKRAIWNDCAVNDLGRISLHSLQTAGRVQIVAKEKVRRGHVEVDNLDILSADARSEQQRPHGYGVCVLQGAFTLWNMQPDEDAVLTADLVNLSVGRFGSPVLGSGIFVGGTVDGGRVNVQRLETNAVYVDGGIAPGTPDQIAGGVFTVSGAYVDRVTNHGLVITYGANDMALDNWGVVDRWVAKEKVTTLGPSSIGLVNFGTIRDLRVKAPIETFGQGARGFNVYDGTVHRAEFDRIVTHGDGAVGVQISQPVGTIVVRSGIETFGGTGPSLVKGAVQNLPATAFSIKHGGSAQLIKVEGGLRCHGKDIFPLEQQGTVESLIVDGGFSKLSSQTNTRE